MINKGYWRLIKKERDMHKRTGKSYESAYRADFPDRILEMRARGLTVIECCAELRICESTYYNYCDLYPEFKAAAKLGNTLAAAQFTREGRENLKNQKFNPVLWQMLGRLGYNVTEHRRVAVKGLAKAKNYDQKIKIIDQMLSRGELTPVEANQLLQSIKLSADVEELTVIKQQLKETDKEINELKQVKQELAELKQMRSKK